MSKIVLIKGSSQYNLARYFIDFLRDAFIALSKDVEIIDLQDGLNLSQIQNILIHPIDFVFSYNGVGLDCTYKEKTLIEVLGAPFVTSLIDHPLYVLPRLENSPHNLVITCVDRAHVNFVKDFYENKWPVFFLPHFACAAPMESNCKTRDLNIIFPGSIRDSANLKSGFERFPYNLRRIINEIVNTALSGNNISIDEVILEVFSSKGIEPFSIYRKIPLLIAEADTYIRHRRREKCLLELGKKGIVLDCFGSASVNKQLKQLHNKHGKLDFIEVLEIMKRAKIVLNIGPNFSYGSHERPLSAMLNGAMAVTDENEYWGEEFDNGKDIVTFKWTELNELSDKIIHYLEKPDALEKMAETGRKTVAFKHTPHNRASAILDIIKEVKNIS